MEHEQPTGPAAGSAPDEAERARRRLQIYLNDHRAGAEGARALAERSAKSNSGNTVGDVLINRFIPELRDERSVLDAARRKIGARDNTMKQWAARAVEFGGRAKLNGSLLEPSPSSTVVELEALMAGVTDKRDLWRVLDTIGYPDDQQYGDLIDQSDRQLGYLGDAHRWATLRAFGGMWAGTPDANDG